MMLLSSVCIYHCMLGTNTQNNGRSFTLPSTLSLHQCSSHLRRVQYIRGNYERHKCVCILSRVAGGVLWSAAVKKRVAILHGLLRVCCVIPECSATARNTRLGCEWLMNYTKDFCSKPFFSFSFFTTMKTEAPKYGREEKPDDHCCFKENERV